MDIKSINNKLVKDWNKLKLKKYRDISKTFLIEGDHLIKEAIKTNHLVSLITMDETIKFDNKYIVNQEIINKLSNLKNVNVNSIGISKYIKSKEIVGNVLILDDIQDPGNLGTIIRSAIAFNFNNIVVSNNTVDLYNDKVIRATEGLIYHINFIKGDLENEIIKLKDSGYKIIGTKLDTNDCIKKHKNNKVAIVMGNEGRGISDSILKMCDEFVTINMDNKVESLNVSVSASILMNEVYNE